MGELDFKMDWVGDPKTANIPDEGTIAAFRFWVDGCLVTRHRIANREDLSSVSEQVIGPMAGIADWLIENWLHIHWDVVTPFPKAGRSVPVFPGVGEAALGWPNHGEFAGSSELATWQHRHLLGHASSDLALPSIVIVPELRHVVIEITPLPTTLNPDVEFCADDGASLTARQFVIRKDSFSSKMGEYIDAVIERAHQNDAFRDWARWLKERWADVRGREKCQEVRQQIMLGPELAAKFEELRLSQPDISAAIKELFFDLRRLKSVAEFEDVVELIRSNLHGPCENGTPSWREIPPVSQHSMPVYTQGYRQAQEVRKLLGLGQAPILDLSELFERLGVALSEPTPTDLFHTAVCTDERGHAKILRSSEGKKMNTLASSRFAQAAALGRLIFRGTSSPSKAFSLAHGDFSRVSQTQRANAFAAELLLPQRALQDASPTYLDREAIGNFSDEYGISRSATDWHARNAGLTVHTS